MTPKDELIEEQIAYYDARAPEYDRMLERGHRYDPQGPRADAPDRDTRELAAATAALRRLEPFGDVLELACGPGWWTVFLAPRARSLTAVDASPTMLALCAQRVDPDTVRLVEANIFEFEPERRYDLVFFGFWLSHVPHDLFPLFWQVVDRALAVDGRVFFIDEFIPGEPEVALDDGRGGTMRELEDGRRFRMVKIFHEPAALEARLRALGWEAKIAREPQRFVHGIVRRAATAGDQA